MSDTDERPQWGRAVLRWALVLAIAGAISYGGVRATDRYRADAATRVFARDWSSFEGCMFGPSSVSDAELPATALAYAKGTGDEAWPHTCSRALTRLANASAALASDDATNEPLKRAATAMESSLGEAIFWTRSVQAHRPRPADWLASYVTLRREVRAWSARKHTALPSPTLPSVPRIPRPMNEPDAPPPPEPVPGGAEADVLDAVATPTHFAWLFRDRRSRYTRCAMRWREGAEPEPIRCGAMTLGPDGDPRDLGLTRSNGDAMLVASARPPSDLRRVLTLDGFEPRLEIAGTSRADRDFVSVDGVAWGVHRARFSLALRGDRGTIERALPADADTLWTDRALGISGTRAVLAWLRVSNRAPSALRWLDATSGASGTIRLLGDWTSYDRTLTRCVSDGRTVWLARDGRGRAAAFATTEDRSVRALSIPPTTTTEVTRAATVQCDGARWAVVEHTDARWSARLFSADVNAAPAGASIEARAEGPSDFAITAQDAWVADGGGPSGALRVRALTSGRTLGVAVSYPALSPPRGVRVIASGARVLVLARAEQTIAFLARPTGALLVPAALAETEPAPSTR